MKEEYTVTGKKKFSFPRNVDTSYGIFGGLSGKDILQYLFPAAALAVLICFLPPFTSTTFWTIKVFVAVLLLIGAWSIAVARPVANRSNIRMIPFLKMQLDFIKRQKVFFIQKKKAREDNPWNEH